MNHTVTFVSGFLDLSQHENRPGWKTIDDYLERGKGVLSLPAPLVLFFENESLDRAKALRPAGFPTEFIPFTFEDCRWYHWYEQIASCIKQHPVRHSQVAKDTARYLVTIHQKIEWLQMVAERNPFSTSHFAWIDFGLFGLATTLRLTTEELLNEGIRKVLTQELPERHIRLCELNFVKSEIVAYRSLYYAEHRWPLAGGFVLATRENINWFVGEIRMEMEECLSRGIAITDEMIWGYILFHHRDRFDTHYGSWSSCLTNYGGALANHAHILEAARLCNHDGGYLEAKRRLDFIEPTLDFSNPQLWYIYWDERYVCSWHLGELDRCERSLLELIRGAEESKQKAAILKKNASRLLFNSSFFIQPAHKATFQRLDPYSTPGERIDCIVTDEFSPYMISPLAVRYLPVSSFRREQYEILEAPASE